MARVIKNKEPRRKKRGFNCAFQSADFQPTRPNGRRIEPAEIKYSASRSISCSGSYLIWQLLK